EMFLHWKDVVGGDGDPGFQKVGMLALAGPDKAEYLRHNARQAQKLGAGVTLISPAEVKALVPAANVDHVALVSYEAESGYADPPVADTVQMTYIRPEHGDLTIHGKLAYGEIVDPDSYNEGADPDQIVKNAELIAHRFPVMEHGLAMGGYSGLYDATPDHHPVLGAIPPYAGLFADFGWSGHGFKHAPVIGDVLSDVILHGRSQDFDLTPFRWTRFRENDLVPS